MKYTRNATVGKILGNSGIWFAIWTAIAILGVVTRIHKDTPNFNNFRIFRGVFLHTIDQLPLYAEYPAEYGDVNHYGIFFSAIIAPFSVLPVFWGALLWVLANTWLLFYAIKQLKIAPKYQGFIYVFALHELFTAVAMQQFNIGLAALIILSFAMIERGKDRWATLFIVIGTLTKIYGVVGLAFFFFSKNKKAFVAWGFLWLALLFVLPMLYSSPNYVIEQYAAWVQNLTGKNSENLFAALQNMGLVGAVRKITQNETYSDLWLILPALALFALPYLRLSQYRYPAFRMMFLASVLLFIILFSTGTEHSGYVIAYVGAALWFILSPDRNARINLVIIAIAFIGTFFVSDLFPAFIRRQYVYPYALKAVPITLVWLKIIYDLCFGNFQRSRIEPSTQNNHSYEKSIHCNSGI